MLYALYTQERATLSLYVSMGVFPACTGLCEGSVHVRRSHWRYTVHVRSYIGCVHLRTGGPVCTGCYGILVPEAPIMVGTISWHLNVFVRQYLSPYLP